MAPLPPTTLIQAGSVALSGFLEIPEGATGLVVFVHGSGSSRFSSRNQHVAKIIREGGMGTLLMDLLTEEEGVIDEMTRELRFDMPLLAERVVGATDWLAEQEETRGLRIGYIGSSTGAAAALLAAAKREVGAVVSRGGRPDLAKEVLLEVMAPTLLIVGGLDTQVLELNRQAFDLLKGEKKLEVVLGATHLFEEGDTLEQASKLARDWFRTHL